MDFKYISHIKDLIDTIENKEKENMEASVKLLTKTIMNKKSIYTFGASHAGILSEELFYRAGGLMLTTPIFGRELMLDTSPITLTSKMERCIGYGTILASKVDFNQDDVLIVHSVSGRNPVTIEVATVAKDKGVKIIGITNLKYSKSVTSRHPSGLKLYNLCDIILDNHGDIGDACVSIDGINQKVSPTSTVIGATMLNAIIAATVQELVNNGVSTPPIFYSANLDNGDEMNSELFDEYSDCIKYKYK